MESNKVYKDENTISRINMCLEFIIENNYTDFLSWIEESKDYVLNQQENKLNKKHDNNENINKAGDFVCFRHVVPYDNENLGFIEDNNDNLEENLLLQKDLDQLLLTGTENQTDKKKFIVNLTGNEDIIQVDATIEIFTFDIMIELC